MTIFDFAGVLSSRKLLLIGVFSTIVSVGMIVTLLLPPTYQSTMKILVTRDRVDPQVTPADKIPDSPRGELTEEDFNSEIEILQSRTVLEGVVRQIGLDKQPAETPRGWLARFRSRLSDSYRSFHGQAAPDTTEVAVTRLRNSLEAVSVKKSRIIKVTCRDSNPERAARILNELYRQYAEHHLRLLQNSKAANVFHEQSEAFSQKLKEATEALKRFDAQSGTTGGDAQQGLLQQRLYEARNQLDKTRTEIREVERRVAALKTQIEGQPERIESEARTKYVAALDKIKDEILTLELQRTQLRQKYLPNHRLVKEVEERLTQARDLLAREEKSPPEERATVLNEIRRHLTSEFLFAQASLPPLREREQRLATLAEQYRAQAVNLDAKSLERAELERSRAVSEEAYLLYRKKAQEADIVNALNQERIVNFSLAESPGVNHTPVSPKPLINFAALVVVGLAAAISVVAFVERSRFSVAEAGLLASSHAGLPSLVNGNRGLALRWVMILLSNAASQGAGRQLTDDKTNLLQLHEQTSPASDASKVSEVESGGGWWRKRRSESKPEREPEPASDQYQGHSSQNGLDNGNPETWRVKAVVDYLYGAYRLPSGDISVILRETAGWEISPAKIDELLSEADADRLKQAASAMGS